MKFHRACVSNCKYKWSGKNSQINKYMSFIWSEPLKMIEKIDKLIQFNWCKLRKTTGYSYY